MITVEVIKISAAIFSILGSAILAYRVSGVLWALGRASEAHDLNITQLMLLKAGRDLDQIYHLGNVSEIVEKAQKRLLIIVGFSLIILSALLQFWALLAELGYLWPHSVPN